MIRKLSRKKNAVRWIFMIFLGSLSILCYLDLSSDVTYSLCGNCVEYWAEDDNCNSGDCTGIDWNWIGCCGSCSQNPPTTDYCPSNLVTSTGNYEYWSLIDEADGGTCTGTTYSDTCTTEQSGSYTCYNLIFPSTYYENCDITAFELQTRAANLLPASN